ncbi:zinc finger CCCH domain-containing protein 10 [Callorhinchus milii]|uniref:zinc finger CCCH domain-containing protein 10 n=1 Tax=Callorhinchus milii TaxID=7868 RepID=UPI0004575831|nr:zinc finger CCCH domain-containing protein 10 [Callorhinchus milii]XP_007908771.1 zinc finger CCCH domain-containing protein 10 [Callorhinchus milii]|eukprot:gi/632983689/ref/XP_007908770.1/ PREDICTED: zinc finger CCCH domain-containing protein 10 [Callorhinchus milii]
MPDKDGLFVGCGSGGDEASQSSDDTCRDFLRNVCKRGKRCKFSHPDISQVGDLGVKKNEFVFCHDFQNKECVRVNCKFIHGTKEDEEHYKTRGELLPHLRLTVAAGLGLSPSDLSFKKGEIPICRDYLKGDCQRGNKCKFRHLKRDEYEHEARAVERLVRDPTLSPLARRYELLEELYDTDRFGDYELALKRRRAEGLRFETYDYALSAPRPIDYRLLDEENLVLRKHMEELKKQVANLMSTNEVLLEQNAHYRNQTKVVTLTTAPSVSEQPLVAPTVGTITNYNHTIAQTHTTLSSQALQPRPVTQQELVGTGVAPGNVQPGNVPPPPTGPHLNAEMASLPAALAQSLAQGMATPVSLAPVAVSVAPVAVSIAQSLPGITISHTTTPMVSYPIASQSMRITTIPH